MFLYFSSTESSFLKYKKNMKIESSISRNRNFSFLELESTISWNIRIFLILELESSLSWNKEFFLCGFFFYFGWTFTFWFKSASGSSIVHYCKLCDGGEEWRKLWQSFRRATEYVIWESLTSRDRTC